jgi:uncharacterized protein YggE
LVSSSSTASTICISLIALAGLACARAVPTTPSITVSGSATLRVPPDRVTFSVGVETQGPAVDQVYAANSKKLEAVVGALKAKGVQPKEIQTSDLEISSRDEQGRRLAGYRVSAVVTVTRDDTQAVGDLLQAAISAGANQAGRLSFSVADPAALRARGLEQAFRDAHAKAEALAGLARRSLGDVLSVKESVTNGTGAYANLASLGYLGSSGIQSGSEHVTFAITVDFALR